MASNKQFHTRNNDVRTYFKTMAKRYPHWKADTLFEKASEKFYLSERTIKAIVKGEGIYTY